uniref:Uncharacterized protein n=1 Tax=Anguilla anguilla TaxID=7936 RepID=A0A0E9R7Z1_ANGAN
MRRGHGSHQCLFRFLLNNRFWNFIYSATGRGLINQPPHRGRASIFFSSVFVSLKS